MRRIKSVIALTRAPQRRNPAAATSRPDRGPACSTPHIESPRSTTGAATECPGEGRAAARQSTGVRGLARGWKRVRDVFRVAQFRVHLGWADPAQAHPPRPDAAKDVKERGVGPGSVTWQ